MLYTIAPGLHRITVRLPQNPLRSLNSYVLTGGERNLLIDTGFNQPECLADLSAGIAALGLDMDRTDIFITHFHADHCGLVTQVAAPGSRIYMGRVDKGKFDDMMNLGDAYWTPAETQYRREGYPAAEMEETRLFNPARRFISSVPFEAVLLEDGDTLAGYGEELRVVFTPGHTPGHLCLYMPGGQTLFTGDHVLFDITPNITWWPEMPDALAQYLQSLDKVRALPVARALTAHRENEGDFTARIDALKAHHADRLEDTMAIVAAEPGIDGYTVASRMKWSIRAKDWGDFPPGQRWFAVGEAIAHIRWLLDAGRLGCREVGGVNRYTVV